MRLLPSYSIAPKNASRGERNSKRTWERLVVNDESAINLLRHKLRWTLEEMVGLDSLTERLDG